MRIEIINTENIKIEECTFIPNHHPRKLNVISTHISNPPQHKKTIGDEIKELFPIFRPRHS
jgi:hypothetical protein